jgi:DNA-binding transcriptional ArsR family regulator
MMRTKGIMRALTVEYMMLTVSIMPRKKSSRIIRLAAEEPIPPRELAGPVSIWSAYGLAANPFFQEELRSDPAAPYPVALHVGRDTEMRLAVRHLGGGTSSRVIVEGAPGIGKTSFVNKLKAEVTQAGMLTHADPVRIVADSTVLSFVADVLRVLLRIRNARGLASDAFWTRTARLVEGEDTMAGGFTLGPIGLSYQGGRVPAEAPLGTLYEVLPEGVGRLSRELGAHVLVHVNNLENLGDDDARRAARLLRDLRDFMMITGAHWIFVGATGVDDAVFREYDQVAGIFPDPIVLEPLNEAEVAELLRRRYDHLAREGAQVVPPVEPQVAADLYGLYRGDLRNFLRLLSDAAALALGVEAIEPLSAERIVGVAAPRYARAIERRVGALDYQHLSRIVSGSRGGEFNVTSAAQHVGIGQSGTSRLIARLREAGLIVQVRTEAKKVFYRPAGQVIVALGLAAATIDS